MKPQEAYVYVISYPCHPYFKIGRSQIPFYRIELFRTASPFQETIDAMIWCPSVQFSKEIERKLHVDFSHKRFRNEWFALSFEDFDYIKFVQNAMDYEKEGLIAATETISRTTLNGFLSEKLHIEEMFRNPDDCDWYYLMK